MDIQSIKKIIFPGVSNIVSSLKDENHNIKVTLLREIFNEAINDALNINHTNNTEVKAMFSGKGKAWAKTEVSDKNPVWLSIKNTLKHEMMHSDPSSSIFKDCSNLLDVFESSGFAWMRFGSVSQNNLRFNLRIKGSKLETHIKLYTDVAYLFTEDITNLEGVPHKLGLEPGIFVQEENKKEVIEKSVSEKELVNIGIQTLENILSQNINNT